MPPTETIKSVNYNVGKLTKILAMPKLKRQRPSAMTLLVVMAVAGSLAAQAKDIIVVQPTLVKLGPTDLDRGVGITSYSRFFKLRCAAAAYATNSTTPVFCITANNTCLVTNATLPPGYDEAGGNPPLHTCYTLVKPLIDKAAALAACGGDPTGCCPPPFLDHNTLGCVFTSMLYFPNLPFDLARKFCQSMWDGCDLFVKRSDLSSIKQYVNSQVVWGPVWLGARADPAGSQTYKWIDGTPVSMIDMNMMARDKMPSMTPPYQVDCVLYQHSDSRGMTDESCLAPFNYLCQIN